MYSIMERDWDDSMSAAQEAEFWGRNFWKSFLFGNSFSPAFDISENDDSFIIKGDLPGMSKDEINVEISNGILSIKGKKKEEKIENNERQHIAERTFGSFERRFRVDNVDITDCKADYKNGVLVLTLPKSEDKKPKKIELNIK